MRQSSKYVGVSLHCCASICLIDGVHCWLFAPAAARCTVTSPLDAAVHTVNVRLNLIGLRYGVSWGFIYLKNAKCQCLVICCLAMSVNIARVGHNIKMYRFAFITFNQESKNVYFTTCSNPCPAL